MKQKSNSRFISFVAQFKQNKAALVGAIIVILLVFVVIFAPQLSPHDPVKASLDERLTAPCMEYPFGTDQLGQCIYSRVLYGSRVYFWLWLLQAYLVQAFSTLY